MKRYLNYAFIYAILAMLAGIFYREFTKWNGFNSTTMLSKVHTHLFVLGMIMFMIIALFAKGNNLESHKTFRIFMIVYNIGLSLSMIMMVIRGITQVVEVTLNSKIDSAISGVAGIGHILIGLGIILLLITLKKQETN